jgi:hypothetical protein
MPSREDSASLLRPASARNASVTMNSADQHRCGNDQILVGDQVLKLLHGHTPECLPGRCRLASPQLCAGNLGKKWPSRLPVSVGVNGYAWRICPGQITYTECDSSGSGGGTDDAWHTRTPKPRQLPRRDHRIWVALVLALVLAAAAGLFAYGIGTSEPLWVVMVLAALSFVGLARCLPPCSALCMSAGCPASGPSSMPSSIRWAMPASSPTGADG